MSVATAEVKPRASGWEVWVLLGLVALVLWLLGSESLSWVPDLIGVLLLATLVLVRWPYGAFLALVAAAAAPYFYVEIHGLKARPEHLVIGCIAAAWLWRRVTQKPKTRLEGLDYLVLLYVALNYVSSALTSPEPSATLRWAVLNNLAVLPYFFIRSFSSDGRLLRWLLRTVVWVGAIEGLYGIACFVSNRAFGTTIGVQAAQYGFAPGTYGTQFEANLFGSYTGCAAAMLLALYLFREKGSGKWLLRGFLIAFAAVLISLSRGALAASALVFALLVLFAWRRKRLRARTMATLVASFAAISLVVLPFAGGFIERRAGSLLHSQITPSSTLFGRFYQDVAAVPDILRHPILGNGTDSFQLLFKWAKYAPQLGGSGQQGAWISNAPLRVLHDTGLAGFATISVFMVWLGLRLRKVLSRSTVKSRQLIALASGALVLAIAFQATDGTLLSFTWIQLGLLVSFLVLLEGNGAKALKERPHSQSRLSPIGIDNRQFAHE